MKPCLRQRNMAVMMLMSCPMVNEVSSFGIQPRVSEAQHIQEECPPCEVLFSKLEKTDRNGTLAQHVMVQERGEPKSGTTIMYAWTTATLRRTCDYLQGLYGEGKPSREPLSYGENINGCR